MDNTTLKVFQFKSNHNGWKFFSYIHQISKFSQIRNEILIDKHNYINLQ